MGNKMQKTLILQSYEKYTQTKIKNCGLHMLREGLGANLRKQVVRSTEALA
jgi:hypothetical protein